MELLKGKETAAAIRQEIKAKVEKLVEQGGKKPHLAAVLVGADGASETYVKAKIRDCAEVGFESSLIRLPDSIGEAALLEEVAALNANDEIDGFIVQLPLPAQINAQKVIMAIDPAKDVDGFHPENIGRMTLGLEGFKPATPMGIMELLKRYDIETSGQHCVVVGRSQIVGLPVSILMGQKAAPGNATVTLCHSRTQDLPEILRSADIIIAALGKPGFLTADMVKDGAVIIDVGTTRVQDDSKKSGFRLAGDVDFAAVAEKCSYITPVPGGVGPMTRVSLLLNTLRAVGGS